MEINKLIKKRLLVFTGTLLIIVILTITSSYALANNEITKTEIQENTNKLLLKYDDNKLNTAEYPMSKEVGLDLAPTNKITIINNDNKSTDYSLMLYPTDISDKSIKVDKVYYSVNGETPKILGDLVDFVIYRGNINDKSNEDITIQIWIDSERVENTDQDKSLNLDFKILNY